MKVLEFGFFSLSLPNFSLPSSVSLSALSFSHARRLFLQRKVSCHRSLALADREIEVSIVLSSGFRTDNSPSEYRLFARLVSSAAKMLFNIKVVMLCAFLVAAGNLFAAAQWNDDPSRTYDVVRRSLSPEERQTVEFLQGEAFFECFGRPLRPSDKTEHKKMLDVLEKYVLRVYFGAYPEHRYRKRVPLPQRATTPLETQQV